MANTISVYIRAYGAQARKELSDTEKGMKRLGDTAGAIGNKLTLFGLGFAGAFVMGSKAMVTFAGKMEQTKVAFTTLMHSEQQAAKFLKELYDYAAHTPFQFPDMTRLAKELMAFGYKSSEVIPILRDLGDAASSLGIGVEGMERLVFSFGQMRARGRITGEEIRELAHAGVPAFEILHQKLGLTQDDMRKLATAGVDAATAIKALREGMGERYGGGQERQSGTLLGLFTTTKDYMQSLISDPFGRGIGDQALPELEHALKDVNTQIERMKSDGTLKKFADEAGNAFASLAKSMSTFIGWTMRHPDVVVMAGKIAVLAGAAALACGPIAKLAQGLIGLSLPLARASVMLFRFAGGVSVLRMSALGYNIGGLTGAFKGFVAAVLQGVSRLVSLLGPGGTLLTAVVGLKIAWDADLFHMQEGWNNFRNWVLSHPILARITFASGWTGAALPNTVPKGMHLVPGGQNGMFTNAPDTLAWDTLTPYKSPAQQESDAEREAWINDHLKTPKTPAFVSSNWDAQERIRLGKVYDTMKAAQAARDKSHPFITTIDKKKAEAAKKAREEAQRRAEEAAKDAKQTWADAHSQLLGLDESPLGKKRSATFDLNQWAAGVTTNNPKALAEVHATYAAKAAAIEQQYQHEILKGILAEGDARDEQERERKDALAAQEREQEDLHQKAMNWIQQEREAQASAADAVIALERRRFDLRVGEAMKGGALSDSEIAGYTAQAAALWDVVKAAKEREETELRTQALILSWMGPAGAAGAAKLQEQADALHVEVLGIELDKTEDLKKITEDFEIRRLEIAKRRLENQLAETEDLAKQAAIKAQILAIDNQIAGIQDPGMPGTVAAKSSKTNRRDDWTAAWNDRKEIAVKAGDEAVDEFSKRFAEMMTGTRDAWKGLWASCIDIFRNALRDLVAAWVKSQMARLFFGGAAAGGAGILGSAASEATGGGGSGGGLPGIGGIFGKGGLSKVFGKGAGASTIGGALLAGLGGAILAPFLFGNNNQSAAGGGIGALAGMLIGGPTGALLGGLFGGALGSLFKKKRRSNLSFSLPTITTPNLYALAGGGGFASSPSTRSAPAGEVINVSQTINSWAPKPIEAYNHDLGNYVARALRVR